LNERIVILHIGADLNRVSTSHKISDRNCQRICAPTAYSERNIVWRVRIWNGVGVLVDLDEDIVGHVPVIRSPIE